MIGRAFGSYVVTGVLAEGSTGIVYRAQHRQLDRPAALKLLVDVDDDERAARFEREAKAAARIQDPHVAQVFELGASDDGVRYLAQELVEGESLAARLERGTLTREAWFGLGVGLAAGLSAIHRAGLVHRDLKPANVILDATDAPKIVDFGLVRDRQAKKHLTQRGSLLGTPLYMAPEQAGLRDAEIGPAADVFALGCVLYEAVTGRVPHDTGDRDMRAFLNRRADAAARVVLPDEVGPDAAVLLQRLLAVEPSERPTAQAVQRALSDLRRRRRGSPFAPAPPSEGRSNLLFVGLGVMLLVGVAGGWALTQREGVAERGMKPLESTLGASPRETPTAVPSPRPAPVTTGSASTPTPTPTASADPLTVGLAALTSLRFAEAEAALARAVGADGQAARALLTVVRGLNGDRPLASALTEAPFPDGRQAPRSAAAVDALGGVQALTFYRLARRALEERRPLGLWLAFRRYGVARRSAGEEGPPPPEAARFLLLERRAEFPALLLIGQAALHARRSPGKAGANLDRVLAPPFATAPLIERATPWLRGWRTLVRVRGQQR